MSRKQMILWAYIPFFFFFSFSRTLQAEDNIVLIWNQTTLNFIQTNKTPPPIAARALAIVHTAIYDAWAAYDNKAIGTRRGETLRRPFLERTEANKLQAISFAAFRTLLDLFPNQQVPLINIMNSLGYDPAYTIPETDTPAGIGNLVALDILNFRHFDGSNQLGNEPGSSGIPYSDYTHYQPANTSSLLTNPSLWQPLSINGTDQKCLVPQWRFVTPFALTNSDQFLPAIHSALYPSKRYEHQAKAIIKLSAKLNDETKTIAEYWSDGSGTVTPPGHWNVIAQLISQRDQHTLDEDAKLFFILDNALLDASIAAWSAKIFDNSIRPISAIRFLFQGKDITAWGGPGQGKKRIKGETWQPYLATPPFPEFVSGHSTFSSAAAQVLKLFTGSDKFNHSVEIAAGSSLIEPGIVPAKNMILSWKTFSEAADQAGLSRRLGGIHFEDGDLQGRKMGKKIGKLVFKKALQFIEGSFD